ncbi:hypothetical protein AB0C34_30930 [Nocardia sp. NPDC049220]|uniref:hypothetical protein n=1 Tax=Nocardia sp. NPDC049220 TaxID=3155273 RepID=UPI0034004054
MYSLPSMLTAMPDIEVGQVTYRPHALGEDFSSPPRVVAELGGLGSALSLTVTDARALFAGLGAALAEHDRHTAAPVARHQGRA